jgi:alpha-1,3-rhamnosyl/mannosyltransferase
VRIGIDARAAAEVPAGRGRYVRELLRALAALDSGHELIAYARERWEPLPGVDWRLIDAREPLWQLRAARAANRECDVFLATNTHLMSAFLRIPNASFVHDMVAFDRAVELPRGAGFERVTLRIARRRADVLLTNSEVTRAALVARLPGAAGKSEATPLAADASFGDAGADCAGVAARHGIERPYVLVTGTLEPRKNLPRAIEAFATLPPELRDGHELVLVGPTGWATDATFRSVAAHGDRVRTLGFVSDEDLRCLYRGAELFLYPSLHEGFGLPVLEAMASGTAVLTSSTSSLPEVGGDAAAYADPHDVASIRAELAALLADPERRRAMAARGREQAARFTWRSTAERTLAALERIAR